VPTTWELLVIAEPWTAVATESAYVATTCSKSIKRAVCLRAKQNVPICAGVVEWKLCIRLGSTAGWRTTTAAAETAGRNAAGSPPTSKATERHRAAWLLAHDSLPSLVSKSRITSNSLLKSAIVLIIVLRFSNEKERRQLAPTPGAARGRKQAWTYFRKKKSQPRFRSWDTLLVLLKNSMVA